jgi:hypothetical protein
MTLSITILMPMLTDVTELTMIVPAVFAMAVNSKIGKRTVKVFSHLLVTSLLLLHKDAEIPSRSIMITCTAKLNIMATIIPGIMKMNNPRTVSTETVRPAMRRVERLDRTDLSATLKVTGFPSNVSEQNLTTIPSATAVMTKPMMVDAAITGILAVK